MKEFLISNIIYFQGSMRLIEKFMYAIIKVVEKCTPEISICVFTKDCTQVIDLIFVHGRIVVNSLRDPTKLR